MNQNLILEMLLVTLPIFGHSLLSAGNSARLMTVHKLRHYKKASSSGTQKLLLLLLRVDQHCLSSIESSLWIVDSLRYQGYLLIKQQKWPVTVRGLCCWWSLHCHCSAHWKCTLTNRSPLQKIFKSVCVTRRVRVSRLAIYCVTIAIWSPLKL